MPDIQGRTAVEFLNVSKSFGPVLATHEVSLSIQQGEFLTVLGPSGCGKSTLLNMIAGFEVQDSGEIRIEGRDVSGTPPYQRDTGMVFQNYALFPHMNVYDNVAFGLQMRKCRKAEIDRRVAKALAMVKLHDMEARRVRQLSGGQQQRVALARAIAFGPKVLLLDEPLSALDKSLRAQMQVELMEVHEQTGLTTVFVTHDQGEALSLSDRIVVMNKGEIQQVSRPLDLYRHPANGFVASFIGEINAFANVGCVVLDKRLTLAFGENVVLSASLRNGLDLRSGDRVSVFIRPEHISVANDDRSADDHNRVVGEVVTHIYQGSHTVTRVEVPALGTIELRVEGGDVIDRKPVGSQIALTIRLDEAVILRD